MDLKPTWTQVAAKIAGLWPRYEPTDAERALIVSRLSGLRMDWLDKSVEDYRVANSSTVFRLAELLEHYKKIANAGESPLAPTRTAVRQQVQDDQRRHDEDAEQAREWLATQPRAEIAAAVQWLRQQGWLGATPLPPRVADWRSNAALMVQARMQVAAEQA